MIATIISMLPGLLTGLFFVVITWIICRLWYTTRYIHRDEVRPLQESQHIMQNQYAILAERIKHTENILAETKAKLEVANVAREEALLRITELEAAKLSNSLDNDQLDKWSSRLIGEVKNIIGENGPAAEGSGDEAEKLKAKEQFVFLRQSIKEFKSELIQKFNASTNQYHEISNQLWQLIELNKKLGNEAEALNKAIQNAPQQQDDKIPDKQFTLTSIKKRS